jgi:hypothetical protein
MRLEDVDPALVAALQHLFDEYGPAGVANVVALMRGEPYGPPAPFIERLERAAERAYTRTSPEPLAGSTDDLEAPWHPTTSTDVSAAAHPSTTATGATPAGSTGSHLRVIHEGEPHWDHYSG